jgi:hypothetical protein
MEAPCYNQANTSYSPCYDIPKDRGAKAVFQKIQFLHTILEACLNMDHALAHPYGDNDDANNAYLEMKTHTLEFTMEQLSCDTLTQYTPPIQLSGKCHGTLFEVVLNWYEQIKKYMWLNLIGLPTQTVCCKRLLNV